MRRALCRLFCFLLVVLLLFTLHACNKRDAQILRVTVVDVGQSDCILLQQGEYAMLIDTGAVSERGAVLAQLKRQNVKELSYVAVTHPHEDHFGNARAVLEAYTVSELLLSPVASEEPGYKIMMDAATKAEVPIRAVTQSYSFALGEALCEVICPIPDAKNANNASLVMRVTFGECVLLFMGDAEQEAEEALIAAYGAELLDCDFLKVGHHGSDTASGTAFLQVTTPTLAAISCGKDNEYGFPHRAVLENFAEAGATVYRTDEYGNLNFICDGKEICYAE